MATAVLVDEGGTPINIEPGTVETTATVDLDAGLNLELELLQKIQNRENVIHNVWAGNYLSCELDTLNRVASRPKLAVDIDTVASSAINGVNQGFATAIDDIIELQSKFCISDNCGPYARIISSRTRSQSWQVQGDLRYEEGRVALENAQRINDRISMISPGRNGVAQAGNALLAASKILGDIARQGDAAKSGDRYAAGRVLEFAKNNIGNLSKLLQGSPTDTPQQSFRTQELEAQNMGQGVIYNPINTNFGLEPEAGFDSYEPPVIDIPDIEINIPT
jgi:hypothetical protein